MLHDLRFAWRLLLRSPVFSVVAVLTLGLAVGANTVVFTIVNSVLLRRLPYAAPAALVRVTTRLPRQGLDDYWLSAPEYLDVARDLGALASVGAWEPDNASISDGDQPASIDVARTTAGLLPTFGVPPLLGRFFEASEDLPGPPRAVILSYGIWRRVFGSDAGIIGKTVHVDGSPAIVVGVMPSGFDYPAGTQAWLPLGIDRAAMRRSAHVLDVVGRLKPGVSLASARSELDALMVGWGSQHPEHPTDARTHPVVLEGLRDAIVRPARASLWILQGAVAFVLLIACANISNLLLARAEERSGEIAVRAALGASRTRLARQLLTESVLLGALGAGVGIVLANWGLGAALALLPDGIPRAGEIAIRPSVLVFAIALSLGASILFGFAPVFHANGSLGRSLRAASQRGDARGHRLRQSLVVAEVALAIVVVVGAGLMVRSFVELRTTSLGFKTRGLVALNVQLPARSYPTDSDVMAFWKRLRDGAASVPGVESAVLMSGLPPMQTLAARDIELVGASRTRDMPPWAIDYCQSVTPGYFDTMGVRLMEGRLLGRGDTATSPSVVVINHTMAKRFWPAEDPVGKRIRLSGKGRGGQANPELTIVGVVSDVHQQGLRSPVGTEAFFTLAQTIESYGALRSMNLLVRTNADPQAVMPALRVLVSSMNQALPIAYMQTMEQLVAGSTAKTRLVTSLLTALASISLSMASIGIYGVLSYSVSRRTRELGIRVALGADAARLERLIVRQGLSIAAVGALVGMSLAAALSVLFSGWVGHFLFQVDHLDPVTYVGVVVLVAIISAASCLLPARRATRVPPSLAMRCE